MRSCKQHNEPYPCVSCYSLIEAQLYDDYSCQRDIEKYPFTKKQMESITEEAIRKFFQPTTYFTRTMHTQNLRKKINTRDAIGLVEYWEKNMV